MKAPAFVLGYHGCGASIAEEVFAGRVGLKPSENDYDWLGTGIYFWENSSARALEWGRLVHSNPRQSKHRIETPSVVGAIIDLGNCLDLLEAESIRLVANGHTALLELCSAAGTPVPKNRVAGGELRLRNLDCAVVNLLHTLRADEGKPAFDSVRAVFAEGQLLYDGAGFAARTHIQICVRDEENIVGYFRPRI